MSAPAVMDSTAAIGEVATTVFADELDAGADAGWDAATWAALVSAGLTTIEVPVSGGGGGGNLVEAAEVVRVAGSFAARMPVVEATLLAPYLLAQTGTPLPPGVLSAADARRTVRASRAARGGWLLQGTARRVSYARFADSVVLLAEGADGPVGVVVDPSATRLARHGTLAGEPSDDLDLTDVAARGGALTPETADTFVLRAALGRLLLGAGAAERVLELSLRQVSEREQFGRAIGRFQVVQHLVAELAGEVTAVNVGADAALVAVQRCAPAAWITVAGAKVDADRSLTRTAAIAHQLHGAIGVTDEHALRRFTLRLWAWRDEAGTAATWADALADRLLNPTGPPLWAQLTGS